jgi:hypothetical protein
MIGNIPGLDRAMRELTKEVQKVEGRTIQGLIKGMLVVMADSQRRTPVDTGNLRASHFLVWRTPEGQVGGMNLSPSFSDEKNTAKDVAEAHTETVSEAQLAVEKPGVAIGVGAGYAFYVHEDRKAYHPVGEWKFLQHAFEANKARFLRIVAAEARKKR